MLELSGFSQIAFTEYPSLGFLILIVFVMKNLEFV